MQKRITAFHTKPRKPMARGAFRRKNTRIKGKTGSKRGVSTRDRLPSIKSIRTKADALLTPIIKLMYPYCLLTGEPTEVAHHHYKKSTSSSCRYYLPNLIPLTHKAHQRLHHDEILWTGRIVQIKGLDWLADLERQKRIQVKTDVHFYIAEHKRLSEVLDSLSTGTAKEDLTSV